MYFRNFFPATVALELDRALRNDCLQNNEQVQNYGGRIRTEVRELAKGWELNLELPGMSREDLNISLDKKELVISGNFPSTTLGEKERVLHNNRLEGKFERRFRLSDEISQEGILATMQNGVLSLRLQKKEQALPTRIEIQG